MQPLNGVNEVRGNMESGKCTCSEIVHCFASASLCIITVTFHISSSKHFLIGAALVQCFHAQSHRRSACYKVPSIDRQYSCLQTAWSSRPNLCRSLQLEELEICRTSLIKHRLEAAGDSMTKMSRRSAAGQSFMVTL